jgi:thiol:disulfide interchange protein DsbA
MRYMVRSSVLVIAALLLSGFAQGEVVQGRDYRLLTPARPTISTGKIEVIEFFSYGCPHCAELHPAISKWAAALPADTAFVRVPVAFGRREWGQLVRAFYALEATGDLAKVDGPLFEAIHKQRKALVNEESLAAWIAQNGGNATKFREAFNSFDVSRKSSQAEQLSRDYQVSGVPQLTVNGKYVVLGQTFDDMLRITNELLAKERTAAKH